MAHRLRSHELHQTSASTLYKPESLEAPQSSLDLRPSKFQVNKQLPYNPAQPNKRTVPRNSEREGTTMSTVSQKPEVRNQPSIVARLMGMDTIPPGKSTVIDAKESKIPKPSSKPNIYYSPRKDSVFEGSPRSAPFRQTKRSLLSYGNTGNPGNDSNISNGKTSNKSSKKGYGGPQKGKKQSLGLRAHKHPQEEALQKFKRDFEAWQSSAVLENNVQRGKHDQILAQEKLNKEKMAKYATKKENAMKKEVHVSEDREKRETVRLPTRIVILKPSFDSKEQIPDPFLDCSNSKKKDCGTVDFLEEVKARLRLEIEGKTESVTKKQKKGKNGITATDPKEIARDIAKQIRENVTRDFHKKLTRSRSFKLPNYVPDPTESVRRDTRRILSEKLKNVLRNEPGTDQRPSTSVEPPRASFIIKRRDRVKSMSEFPNIIINREYQRNDTRRKLDSIGINDADNASPRSLFRSFSAPVSRTTLRKLLLEDSELTKCCEEEEHNSGFEGKVSSLKHNLSMKGKLFGNKTHALKAPKSEDLLPLKVIRTIPSALANSGPIQENYMEIPPSPASVSSSSHNEFSGGDNQSPVSPLEVSSHASRKSFGDMNTLITDASTTMQQRKEETEEAEFTENSKDTEIIEILNPDIAYLKEILVTAGLYEKNNPNQTNLYINFAPRSLSFQIFEEIEAAYNKNITNSAEDPSRIWPHDEMERRVLFDLTNESVQKLYGANRITAALNEWVATSATLPSGAVVLDEIWKQIDTFIDPPMDQMQTIDSMVGHDVRNDAWTSKMYEEKDVMCRKIGFVVYMELMDEFLREMGIVECKL